jgi:adenine phosphoribosyltransferase
VVELLALPWVAAGVNRIAGIEARGFILGGALAARLGAGFVPIRKKGKLPHATVRVAYSLEYGVDEMEMHSDAVGPGEDIILVDDLIATGGTAAAAVQLLRTRGARVLAACFIADLPDLGGSARLATLGVPVKTLVSFSGH